MPRYLVPLPCEAAVREYERRGGRGTVQVSWDYGGWIARVLNDRGKVRGYIAPGGVLVPAGNRN